MLLESGGNDNRDAGRLALMCSNLQAMHKMVTSIAADW